jgi:geranylgeranyl pyrophosphate synthase
LSNLNEIFQPIQDDLAEVEVIMHSSVQSQNPDLSAALERILAAGGKRIRPAISLLTAQILQGPMEKIHFLAASVEVLHSATLVHDDLIDNSLIRRGMQTLNAKWSPGATVLTGDYLFSCSARLAAETESTKVVRRFAETLSIIVNGEITQLFSGPCRLDREDYYQRIYAKTASLFETCSYCSALLSTEDRNTHEVFRTFGKEIGMAFQIVDDILDYTGDQVTLGKPIGSDLQQGLLTLPLQIYAERYPDKPFVKEIISGNCLDDRESIQALISDITKTEAIQESFQIAREFSNRGIQAIEGFPRSDALDSLIKIARFIVDREM